MLKLISDQHEWNSFVKSLSPNTFLHSWQWGQVQISTGEEVTYLGYYESDKLIGVALLITVNAKRGRHYLIPHGPLTTSSETYAEVIRSLVSYAQEKSKADNSVALRIAPLVEKNSHSVSLFREQKFRPAPIHVHAERTWIVDISTPEENILQNMRKTTRHAVRKAQKVGVNCEIITDTKEALERFWPLYEKTRSRHGFVLWPKDMIQKQLDIFSEANAIYTVIASYENKDVAAAIIPIFGSTAYYYHGASEKLPSSIPAAQLLQFEAMREAKRREATQYNFWGIKPEDADESHPFHGITTFKQGFGGHAVNYLHAQDLPLSLGYWKLWAVDSYRKYKRGF